MPRHTVVYYRWFDTAVTDFADATARIWLPDSQTIALC